MRRECVPVGGATTRLSSLPSRRLDKRLPDLCTEHYQTIRRLGVKRTLDRLAGEFPICLQCVRLAQTLEREGLVYDEERAMGQSELSPGTADRLRTVACAPLHGKS